MLGRASAAITGCSRTPACARRSPTPSQDCARRSPTRSPGCSRRPARSARRSPARLARRPSRRARRPRARCEGHAGLARLWTAARRASKTRCRRCSRLSLMVVRTYLCHSKPSLPLRLPNMAVLLQAFRYRWAAHRGGAPLGPREPRCGRIVAQMGRQNGPPINTASASALLPRCGSARAASAERCSVHFGCTAQAGPLAPKSMLKPPRCGWGKVVQSEAILL